MSIELLYTSAPQGLKPSSRGFCTVLSTTGMPVNLATRLEGLSAYRHAFPPNTPEAAQNPVCYSHLKMTVGGQRLSVLSRIADYGVDYSQRTNKIAHHVVVSAGEQVPAGPAWAMLQSRVMRAQWDGQCATPAAGPTLQLGNQAPAICAQWAALTGEAGWGAILAEALAQSVGKPTWIVFSLEQSPRLLGLINEAIALLPERERWQATFSTYVTNLPPDVDCRLRCVLAGTDEARLAPARGTVIDLTQPLPPPASNHFTQIAVEGNLIAPKNDSVASTVASTAIQPMADAHTASAHDLGNDEDEIEYLDDDDSSAFDDASLGQKLPIPPPRLPKPPRIDQTVKAAAQKQVNRRWILIAGIVTCLTLMGLVVVYLVMPKEHDRVGEHSRTAINSQVVAPKQVTPADFAAVDSTPAAESKGTPKPEGDAPTATLGEPVNAGISDPADLAHEGEDIVEGHPAEPARDAPAPPLELKHDTKLKSNEIPEHAPASEADQQLVDESEKGSELTEPSVVELEFVAQLDLETLVNDNRLNISGDMELSFPSKSTRYMEDLTSVSPKPFINDNRTTEIGTTNPRLREFYFNPPQKISGKISLGSDRFRSEREKLLKSWKAIDESAGEWNNFIPIFKPLPLFLEVPAFKRLNSTKRGERVEPYGHIRTTLDLAERFNSDLTQAIEGLSESQKTANKQQLEKASLLLTFIKTSAKDFSDAVASIEQGSRSELSDLGIFFYVATRPNPTSKWQPTTPVHVSLKLIPHAPVSE